MTHFVKDPLWAVMKKAESDPLGKEVRGGGRDPQEQKMMEIYGECSDFGSRFMFLAWGILGFFFPGWYMHTSMRLFKTFSSMEEFENLLSNTESLPFDLNKNQDG